MGWLITNLTRGGLFIYRVCISYINHTKLTQCVIRGLSTQHSLARITFNSSNSKMLYTVERIQRGA